MQAYSALASFYDRLMEYPYSKVADLVTQGLNGKKTLDLFCGTGKFTVELAKKGLSVVGSDISQEMLNQAMINARENGYNIVFKKENALKFSYSYKFDLITAISDGLNYVKPSDVNSLFDRVSNALSDSGKFVFDISTEYKLKTKIGDNIFYEDTEDLVYFWRNQYKEKDGSVKMDLTFFEKTSDGTYKRSDESQKQYVHTLDEIKVLAKCYSFKIENILDIDTFEKYNSKSKRLLFILTKI